MLSPEQATEYRPWFGAEKRLRALVHELEDLGLSVREADPRSPPAAAGSQKGCPAGGKRVTASRLICGLVHNWA